ncbi:MAG TPA: alpha-ribazole phosphatase, partial [Bacteroidales bacterium]
MKLIAIRHTTVNVPAGLCYGQTDVDTANSYDTEKNEIVSKLKNESFQAVYSSPSLRCRKLAEDIANGTPVTYDSRLLELNFGSWEGKTWDEITPTTEANNWFKDWINQPCPNGESYRQLLQRVKEFTTFLKQAHTNETLLVVTHSGVIRALSCLLTGLDPN